MSWRARSSLGFVALSVGATVAAGLIARPAADGSSAKPPLLIPAPEALRQTCQTVTGQLRSEHARWRIVCPTRMPYTIGIPLFSNSGDTSTVNYRQGYLIDCIGFLPANGHVHWIVAGGNPRTLDRYFLHPTNAIGQPESTVTQRPSIRLDAQVVNRYLVSPGTTLYSDHVVLVWLYHGEEYQVSIHRWPNTSIATAQATAVASNIIQQQRH
jgi:hypothetical protein